MVKSHTHGMQHYHYTDLAHGHTVNDPGHYHNTPLQIFNNPNGALVRDGCALGINGDGIGQNNNYSSRDATGITVNDLSTTNRWSSGAYENAVTQRLSTDSNDTNAIENRPINYTVKIWKRTA